MEKLLKFKKLFMTGLLALSVGMFAVACVEDDDDPIEPDPDPILRLVTVTITGEGQQAGASVAGIDPVYLPETDAYAGEIVYLFEGNPVTDSDHEFLRWETTPASLANQIVELDGGIWEFTMPDRDVTIRAVWGIVGDLPDAFTSIRYNWDAAEEVVLDYVFASAEDLTIWYEVLDELLAELDIEEDLLVLLGLLTEFPRYPGIEGLPTIFLQDVEVEADHRNVWFTWGEEIDEELSPIPDSFTAVASVYVEEEDEDTGEIDGWSVQVVANYRVEPATTVDLDYTLIFDIGMFLEESCEVSAEGECVIFGLDDEVGEIAFEKRAQQRQGFIRRVPGVQKLANGLEVSYWVIRRPVAKR